MRVRLIEILCVVVTVAACSQAQRSFDSELVTLAISPVAAVDVEGGRSIPGLTVLLAGDSIGAIGPVREIAIPPGADRLEAADGFLMPGLWDMHVHLANPAEPVLSPERQLEEYLRWGVVGVRDMGGDWSELLRLKAAVTEERSKGPRIVAAGPFLDGDGEEPLFLSVAEAGQRSIEHLSPALPSDAGLLFSCSSREDELRAELAAIQEERQREEVDRKAIGQRRIRLQRDLLKSFSRERVEAVANVLIGEGT